MCEVARTHVHGEEDALGQARVRGRGQDAPDREGLEIWAKPDARGRGEPPIGRSNGFARKPAQRLVSSHRATLERENRLERRTIQVGLSKQLGDPPWVTYRYWACAGFQSLRDQPCASVVAFRRRRGGRLSSSVARLYF